MQGKLRKLVSRPAFSRTPAIAVNNGVDFGATPASAQISMRSKPVTQSNAVVVRKSSIRKLPNIYRKQECFNLPIKLFILLFLLPLLSQIKFVRMIKNKNNMKKTIEKKKKKKNFKQVFPFLCKLTRLMDAL